MYPPIANGTRVRAIPKYEHDRTYNAEAIRKRDTHAGEVGVVCDYHDSYGLCYEVQFAGGRATFDPDELEMVPSLVRLR